MRKTVTCLTGALCLAFVASAQAAPLVWDWTYDAARSNPNDANNKNFPDTSGSIVKGSNGVPTSAFAQYPLTLVKEDITGGIFTAATYDANTNLDKGIYFSRSAKDSLINLNYNTGYTVEIRFRINGLDTEEDHPAAFVLDVDGDPSSAGRYWSLGVVRSGTQYTAVLSGANTTTPLTVAISSADFHTYRVTSQGDTATLYMDDNPTPVGSINGLRATNTDKIRFGDLTNVPDSDYSIDYIHGYNGGAVAPVPEPAALGLLAVGALLLRRRRRG